MAIIGEISGIFLGRIPIFVGDLSVENFCVKRTRQGVGKNAIVYGNI